jgi:hypothetical protein
MSDNELLDSMFLSLADAFEANKRSRSFSPSILTGRMGTSARILCSPVRRGSDALQRKESWGCALTPQGYTTYRSRIEALRAFWEVKNSLADNTVMMNQTEFFRVSIPSGIRIGAATLGTFLSRDVRRAILE